jgi:hypothetical protein
VTFQLTIDSQCVHISLHHMCLCWTGFVPHSWGHSWPLTLFYCCHFISFPSDFCVPSQCNCNLSTVRSYSSDLRRIALFFQGRQCLKCKYVCFCVIICLVMSLNTVAMNIVVLHVTGLVCK